MIVMRMVLRVGRCWGHFRCVCHTLVLDGWSHLIPSHNDAIQSHSNKGCPFPAAFWECPPLLPSHIIQQQQQPGADDSVEGLEFVLVDAPELLASVAGG